MKFVLNFNLLVEKDDCMCIDLLNNFFFMRKYEKDGCDYG